MTRITDASSAETYDSLMDALTHAVEPAPGAQPGRSATLWNADPPWPSPDAIDTTDGGLDPLGDAVPCAAPRNATPSKEADLTGSQVGPYVVVDVIGRGGCGTVYRGRDTRALRNVAIKVLRPGAAPVPSAGLDLRAEADALSRCVHPHVASLYEVVTERGCDFLVMEFVPGATLKDVILGGPLPAAEVIRLGAQLLRGVAAAHAAGVVHGDLKPGNLKVTSSGDLKILDFGLARLMPGAAHTGHPDGHTSSGMAGTLPYMAPEQLRGELIDERSDLYSVGVVLYEMATGRRAFPQAPLASLLDAVLRLMPIAASEVHPLVPKTLERIITKALAKRPGQRYQSASAMADALEALAAYGSPASGPKSRGGVRCLVAAS